LERCECSCEPCTNAPAILEEYADVLGDHPEFVAEIVESFPVCFR
jgi:hypothetical protein